MRCDAAPGKDMQIPIYHAKTNDDREMIANPIDETCACFEHTEHENSETATGRNGDTRTQEMDGVAGMKD
jgi:hypothetical protein